MHDIFIFFNIFNLTYVMCFLFHYFFLYKNNCGRKYIPEVKFATD